MQLKPENEQATIQFAEDFALCLRKGDLVTLSGDLGAGKSTLARALIRALADDAALAVPSPTFTLVQIYEETRLPLAHADIYRLSGAEELAELGLDEARQNGIVLVEWPEKAGQALADAQFALKLEEGAAEDSRILTIQATDEAYTRLAHSLKIRAFLREHGRGKAVRRYLQGDASPRGYEKLHYDDAHGSETAHSAEILMDAPITEIHDAERAAYIKQAHLAADNHAFIAIDELLIAQGFKAPAIYAKNHDETLLILEDLGRQGILTPEGAPDPRRYLAAAEFLAEFHKTDWVKAADERHCRLPFYDIEALNAEADLFADWYVPFRTGKPASDAFRSRLRALWQPLFAKMQEGRKVLVMRDFHSPNILWQDKCQGVKRIGLIDFQDAALGQAAYDVVSLAQDARADISPDLEQALKTAYSTACHALTADFNEEQFNEAYAILGAQRAVKILGIFVRLKMRDGKANYMRHLPRMAEYFERNLRAPALAELRLFLRENGLAA